MRMRREMRTTHMTRDKRTAINGAVREHSSTREYCGKGL